MNTSENINELAGALAKAQGNISCAIEDKTNPHYKNSYASLSSVWDACRKPLSDNGLAVVQLIDKIDNQTYLITTITHASGQWIKSQMPINIEKVTPQGLGSLLTYYRRYMLSSMVGIAPGKDDAEEDDGTIAQKEFKPHSAPTTLNEFISNVQVQQIKSLIPLTGRTENDFVQWIFREFNADTIERIKKQNFDAVILRLNSAISMMKEVDYAN